MTPQEIFDTVVTHLFTQGHPSKSQSEIGRCLYKAPNGDMCAVGCLIKDYYVPEMDQDFEGMGTNMNSLLKRFGDILPSWVNDNVSLLVSLQDIHDNGENWLSVEHMKLPLKFIAKHHSLDSTIVDNFNKFGKQS